ncbi:hypothetical protein SPHV1_220103 [Novosphingobium sp. KN65.2]|nr:hypothetical protein SPHV1_220103 [Novosphingobium sp. KN65.2]
MGESGGAIFVIGCHVATAGQGAAKASLHDEGCLAQAGLKWAWEEDRNGLVATWQPARENGGGRQEMHHG